MSILLTKGNDHACLQTVASSEAEVIQRFNKLAAAQAELSKVQLCERQAALLGPQGLFSRFSRQVAAQGRQAPALADLPQLDDPLREEEVHKALDYVLGLHQRRICTVNPLKDLSRPRLCCMVFDEQTGYSLAERFTACEALKQKDSLYFARLIATTRHTVERRLVFMGLLEHFDSLLPIEKSIYPLDYRSAQHSHLVREETLYGKLVLDTTVSELLERRTTQWIMDNLCIAPTTAD